MPGLSSLSSGGRSHSDNTDVRQEGNDAAGRLHLNVFPLGWDLAESHFPTHNKNKT